MSNSRKSSKRSPRKVKVFGYSNDMTPERLHTPEFSIHNPKLIYSCHLDFVHPHLRWKIKGNEVRGVLDNIAPAAILFSRLNELKGEVHFTENEETTMADAYKLGQEIIKRYPPPADKAKYWGDRSWLPTVCVLDVTDQGGQADVTFENFVFFDSKRIREMMAQPSMHDITYEMIPSGGWDETYAMAEKYIPSFSFCLPVYGPDMHTFGSTTNFERIAKYRRVLSAIDKTFS